MRSRTKPLVSDPAGTAYVVDDPSTGSPRYLWKNNAPPYQGTMVVGTCNGLICLCDNWKSGGAITLVNPVTVERLSLPPMSSTAGAPEKTYFGGWHEAYGFGYHPTAGRHKVVHVPDYGRKGNSDQVRVFTLGDSSWRDVATGSLPRCNYSARIVGVDGTMYWAAKNGKKLMAFHLDHERLTFIKSPPDVPSDGWHLTEVRARLGILYSLSPAEKSLRPADKILKQNEVNLFNRYFRGFMQSTELKNKKTCPTKKLHHSLFQVWVLEGAAAMKEHKYHSGVGHTTALIADVLSSH